MAYANMMMIRFLAIITFLAGIAAMVKGSLVTIPVLLITLLLTILLAIAVMRHDEEAVSYFLLVLFFTGELANVAFLYSLAGYLSLARLGVIIISVIGLVASGANMLVQPVPEAIRQDVRQLLAAERKISEAKETLKKIKEIVPKEELKPARKKKGSRKKKK